MYVIAELAETCVELNVVPGVKGLLREERVDLRSEHRVAHRFSRLLHRPDQEGLGVGREKGERVPEVARERVARAVMGGRRVKIEGEIVLDSGDFILMGAQLFRIQA